MNKALAKRGVIIARVSDQDQAKEDRFSIPTQRTNLKQYAEREKIEVVNEYLIKGESAHKGGRKKFQAAIDEAIELSKASSETIAILMTEDDRYCRKVFHEAMQKVEKAREAGQLELHFSFSNSILNYKSNPDDVLGFRIRCDIAEHDSAKKSRKVKEAIKYKKQEGLFPGGMVVTGYKNVKVEIEPEVFRKEIQIDPERAPFVKRVFKLYLTGKYSQSKITKIMRREGFTGKIKRVRVNGKLVEREPKLVNQSDIFRILRNPFYFGKFYYKNQDTGERELYPKEGICKSYKPLFDDWKMFEAVQEMLNSNGSKKQDKKEDPAKFRGLVRCGYCNCLLTPENLGYSWKNESSNNGMYYHCTSGKMHKDHDYYKNKFGAENHSGVREMKRGENKGKIKVVCPQHPWWKESEIEQLILDEFECINYGEEVFSWLREQLDSDYQDRAEAITNQIKAAKDKHTKNEDLIKALVRSMATENDIDLKAAYREQWQALKLEQEELREDIRIFEEAADSDTDSVIKKLQYCSNLGTQYQQLDNEGRKELLYVCFREIVARRGKIKGKGSNGIHFVWNEPFNTLLTLNIEEMIAEAEALNSTVTETKEMEASPKP